MKNILSMIVALVLMIGFAEWSVGIVEQKLEEKGRQNEVRLQQQIVEINRKQRISMRKIKERTTRMVECFQQQQVLGGGY